MNGFHLLLAEEVQSTVLGSVFNSIKDGGWMMVPIAACSIVAVGFFFERFVALRRGRLIPGRFANEIGTRLDDRGIEHVLQYTSELKAPVARIFSAGLRRWHEPRANVEKAVEDAGNREVQKLSGNLRPLLVVASVAPLLGLLGTVMGMIKAFSVIATEAGIGKPEMLADGISQALVTTAAGLIVAIPAQIGFFYLKARIDKFTRDVETIFTDTLAHDLDRRAAMHAAEQFAA